MKDNTSSPHCHDLKASPTVHHTSPIDLHHKHFHEEEPTDETKPIPHKNYTPLHWNTCFEELIYLQDGTSVFKAGNEGPIFFCIHGAGQSALSFAMMAAEVKKFGTVLAIDLKAHGLSKKEGDSDFSIQTLCGETIEALKQIMLRFPEQTVIVVGHSLGGSIACRVVDVLYKEKEERIAGCVVIDAVEGTAIEAIPFVKQVITDRPHHFQCVESAIKWCFATSTVRKLESARVSVPSQIIQRPHGDSQRLEWRVNLSQTEQYWLGWFKGLSQIFLGLHVPKVLIVADKQRLDKELTIAQMQGKFKVVVLHGVGHAIPEDDYHATAKQLFNFVHDFRIPLNLSEKAERQLVGVANFHPHLVNF